MAAATRRGLFAAASVLPLTGMVAEPHPDADLLLLAEEFRRITSEIGRLSSACRAAGENDPAAEAAWDAACGERDAIELRLYGITPRTPAGVVAKAGVGRDIADYMRQPGLEPDFDLKFAERVMLDVLTLHGQAAA